MGGRPLFAHNIPYCMQSNDIMHFAETVVWLVNLVDFLGKGKEFVEI